MFDAVLIEKSDSGQEAGLSRIDTSQLPQGDVLVEVAWSTLNYKDALAIGDSAYQARQTRMPRKGRISTHPRGSPQDDEFVQRTRLHRIKDIASISTSFAVAGKPSRDLLGMPALAASKLTAPVAKGWGSRRNASASAKRVMSII